MTFRCSLIATSTFLQIRLWANPLAIADSDFIEQGQMMEASDFTEPDENTSLRSCSDRIGPVLASRSNPSGTSVAMTILAASETIVVSWDPLLFNSSANLIP